jgi:hypothetical protein
VLVELHGPEARAAALQALTAARYRLCRIARGFPPIHQPDALAWKAHLAAFPEASHG